MTEKEYLEALEADLRIGDEESRNTVLRFCEEMIDDRMENGLSEEEAVAAMEDVHAFAVRMNGEYEEMIAQKAETGEAGTENAAGGAAEVSADAGKEASAGNDPAEDIGKMLGDAAEKAGKLISGFASAVKKSILEAREAMREADEDTEESDRKEFENGADSGEYDEIFSSESGAAEAFSEDFEKKQQEGAADDAVEAIRKFAGKVKNFVKPILRDTRDTLQKYVNGEANEEKTAEENTSAWRQEEISVPSGEIGTVTLNAKNFAVRVHPGEGEDIRLVYWTSEKTPYTVKAENGELTLTGAQEKGSSFSFSLQDLLSGKTFKEMFSSPHGDIELYLPECASADLKVNASNGAFTAEDTGALKTVNVHTSNGHISLDRICCEAFDAHTSNGSAELNGVRAAGEAVIESSNGTVTVRGTEAGEIRVKTSNATVTLEGVTSRGILTAVTSNARCSATHSVCEGDLTLQSSNGPVRAEICDCAGFTAITSNGGLRAEGINACAYTLRTSNASVTGTLPGSMERYGISSQTSNGKNSLPAFSEGEIPLKVNTSNGSIQISFAG